MHPDMIQSVIHAPYSPVVCPSEIVYMLLVGWMSCSSYFAPSLKQQNCLFICVYICVVVAKHGRLEDAGTRSGSQKGGKRKRSKPDVYLVHPVLAVRKFGTTECHSG